MKTFSTRSAGSVRRLTSKPPISGTGRRFGEPEWCHRLCRALSRRACLFQQFQRKRLARRREFQPMRIVAIACCQRRLDGQCRPRRSRLTPTVTRSRSFPISRLTVTGRNITPEQVNEFAAKVQSVGIDVGSENISIGTWFDAGIEYHLRRCGLYDHGSRPCDRARPAVQSEGDFRPQCDGGNRDRRNRYGARRRFLRLKNALAWRPLRTMLLLVKQPNQPQRPAPRSSGGRCPRRSARRDSRGWRRSRRRPIARASSSAA